MGCLNSFCTPNFRTHENTTVLTFHSPSLRSLDEGWFKISTITLQSQAKPLSQLLFLPPPPSYAFRDCRAEGAVFPLLVDTYLLTN